MKICANDECAVISVSSERTFCPCCGKRLLIEDTETTIIGLKKYLDVIPRFDELNPEEQKRFLDDFKRDYNTLIHFLEEYST